MMSQITNPMRTCVENEQINLPETIFNRKIATENNRYDNVNLCFYVHRKTVSWKKHNIAPCRVLSEKGFRIQSRADALARSLHK